MVIVSVELPPIGTAAGVNDLATVGLPRTTSCAAAGAPLPAEPVRTPVVFVYAPATLLVTLTVIVQVPPPAGIVPAVIATELPAGPAGAVTMPPHVLPSPGTAVLNTFAGYVSLIAA